MLTNKKVFWNTTMLYGFGFLSIRFVSFLLLPLHTNLLSPEVVGFIFLLMTLLAFLNTLYNHGMDAAMLKFFYEHSSRSVISTSILYSIISGFFLSGFIVLFSKTISKAFISNIENIYFVICLCFVLFCDMLSVRLLNVLRMNEKPYYYLFVCLINVFTCVCLNILFIKNLKLGFDGALFALVGTALMQILILLPVLINNVSFSLFDKNLLNKMIRFSLPVFPAAMFLVAVELTDRWMLKWFDSVESVGLYGSGYKLGGLVLIIVKSFNLNWQPYYLKYKENYKEGGFGKIGTSLILVLISLCTFFSLAYPYIIQIRFYSFYLIGEAFWVGAKVIPIISFSYLLYGLFILQMPSVYLKNKQIWLPVFWGLGFACNVVGNIFLIPLLSYMGAAVSTLISYFVMSCFIIYKNTQWMPIQYNYKKIIFLLCVSIALICLQSFYFYDQALFITIVYLLFCFIYIKNIFILPR